MGRVVVTVSLRRGSRERVRQILREGPPVDLAELALDRHLIFHMKDELVFLFEGEHAEKTVRSMLADPRVFRQANRIGRYVKGPPRLPQEVFSWERPEEIEGLSFGPQPGPGDSEGGAPE